METPHVKGAHNRTALKEIRMIAHLHSQDGTGQAASAKDRKLLGYNGLCWHKKQGCRAFCFKFVHVFHTCGKQRSVRSYRALMSDPKVFHSCNLQAVIEAPTESIRNKLTDKMQPFQKCFFELQSIGSNGSFC